jgi:hypothetical protein
MDLTLREGHTIKCCMKLIALISHNNYHSQLWTPSTDEAILPYSSFLKWFCQNLITTSRFTLFHLCNNNFNLKMTGTRY